jgi:hypothetical protein
MTIPSQSDVYISPASLHIRPLIRFLSHLNKVTHGIHVSCTHSKNIKVGTRPRGYILTNVGIRCISPRQCDLLGLLPS